MRTDVGALGMVLDDLGNWFVYSTCPTTLMVGMRARYRMSDAPAARAAG
jgi:hypothetical protein